MSEVDLSQKFLLAAQQRFTAAEILLKNSLNLEAVYIAGYTIECSLKAVILMYAPAGQHDRIVERFKKHGGHDFEALKQMLDHRHVRVPSPLIEKLRRDSWSTDLRYEIGTLPTKDAEAFVGAAAETLGWASGLIANRK